MRPSARKCLPPTLDQEKPLIVINLYLVKVSASDVTETGWQLCIKKQVISNNQSTKLP